MTTLACDKCAVTAEGETFGDWMKALMPHYQSAHPEVMTDTSKTAADQAEWMADNRARFEAAQTSQTE